MYIYNKGHQRAAVDKMAVAMTIILLVKIQEVGNMIYVTSDIHGNKQAFQSILEQINLQAADQLYILGDVIDRYPDGIEVLQQIMRTPNMHMLLGNHEYMMLEALGFSYEKQNAAPKVSNQKALKLWHHNGGRITYHAWNRLTAEAKEEIVSYLQSLPLNRDVVIGKRHFKLVHGAAAETYEASRHFIGESKASYCVWNRDSVLKMADSDCWTTIFGHTATTEFQDANPPRIFHHKMIIGMDCGSGWYDPTGKFNLQGRLACLRLDDMREFYSK